MQKLTASTGLHYAWKRENTAWKTGVSLHGHTWNSKEGLGFLPGAVERIYILPNLLKQLEKKFLERWGAPLDYARGYWTSPVSPAAAYALESKQIEAYGMKALVSITDHDEVAGCKDIVSLEWTFPYKGSWFHIGVHNLPEKDAKAVYATLTAATGVPDDAGALRAALAEAASFPQALIVLNHPLVDQGRLGKVMHASLVEDILRDHGEFIHALELNALQPWAANRGVFTIGERFSLPLVAGGDRHGFEPNGAVNLTNAVTFGDFAREIREEKKSNILFMPQYRAPLVFRYTRNVQTIMAEYPELGDRARWHDRVFYECPDGVTRSITQMTDGPQAAMISTTNLIVGAMGFMNGIAQPIAPFFAHSKADLL